MRVLFDKAWYFYPYAPKIYLHINKLFIFQGCFEGYNATVLAYGQTGSGKTFTMGTGFDMGIQPANLGIIPRAVRHLFDGVQQRVEEAKENNVTPPEFKVSAQFMELYNEEIIDLFDNNPASVSKGKKSGVRIHEDANGNIYTVGVTSRTVTSEEDTLQCLKTGAFNRHDDNMMPLMGYFQYWKSVWSVFLSPKLI